jgi:hypothetical protein
MTATETGTREDDGVPTHGTILFGSDYAGETGHKSERERCIYLPLLGDIWSYCSCSCNVSAVVVAAAT